MFLAAAGGGELVKIYRMNFLTPAAQGCSGCSAASVATGWCDSCLVPQAPESLPIEHSPAATDFWQISG